MHHRRGDRTLGHDCTIHGLSSRLVSSHVVSVWVCVRERERLTESQDLHCTTLSLPLSPSLSFPPSLLPSRSCIQSPSSQSLPPPVADVYRSGHLDDDTRITLAPHISSSTTRYHLSFVTSLWDNYFIWWCVHVTWEPPWDYHFYELNILWE